MVNAVTYANCSQVSLHWAALSRISEYSKSSVNLGGKSHMKLDFLQRTGVFTFGASTVAH